MLEAKEPWTKYTHISKTYRVSQETVQKEEKKKTSSKPLNPCDQTSFPLLPLPPHPDGQIKKI